MNKIKSKQKQPISKLELRIQQANNYQFNPKQLTKHKITIIKCSQMTSKQFEEVFQITKENMYDLASKSSLGWEDSEKMEEMKQKDGFYILFEEGFVCIRFEKHNKKLMCYLWEIQLKKQFHHQGIGTEMMNVIEKICKLTRCDELCLLCLHTNENAKKFYEKLGFDVSDKDSDGKDYIIFMKEFTYN